MKIIYTQLAKYNVIEIKKYIAKDKQQVANDFVKELRNVIENLVNFPFKYRKSFYLDDENVRDMTFKGYSIIYRINHANEFIEILEIFNRNLPKTSDTIK